MRAAVCEAVVFEELGREHRRRVRGYLRRGHVVYYRRALDDFGDDAWLTACVREHRLRPLVLEPPFYAGHNESSDLAFETVETAWARLGGLDAVRRVTRLYGDETIHLAFKKLLLQRLSAFFATDLLVRRIAETLGGRPLFVAAAAVTTCDDGRVRRLLAGVPQVAPAPACRFPWWQRLAGTMRAVADAVGVRGLALYGIAGCVVRSLQGRRRAEPPRAFAVGVNVVNTLRQLANDVRGIDFLVDDREIRREATALVSARRPTPDEAQEFRARGLAVCVAERVFAAPTLRRVVREGVALLWSPRAPRWLRLGAWHLVEDWGLWTSFAARHHIGTLVTHADHGFRHVARTLVLRRAGTRVWYYIDSWNYSNLYATPSGRPYRHWLWAYLCYDVLVSWNGAIVDYFQAHRQRVGRYVTVGCLWAEHVRLLREGRLRSEARDRVAAGVRPGQRVVAVFPAWYEDNGVIPPEDGLAFVEDLQRLLDEFPDVLMVVKEKYPRWHFVRHPNPAVARAFGSERYARIYRAYDEMERRPRCVFPGYAMSPSELIAASDLVISDPFTSTTYEALASGGKALYHDARGRHRGAFYDRIPGLVTHGYPELAARVRDLLDETSAAEYVDHLKKHFVGALEPDLEGLALTRFRALLAGQDLADVGAWSEIPERSH